MKKTFIVVIVLSALLAGCGGTDDLRGAELFAESCARCHGADATGLLGPSLGPGSRAATELTDEQIANTIRVGPGVMPSFSRLSDDQIDSLVAFIRSLSDDDDAAGQAP